MTSSRGPARERSRDSLSSSWTTTTSRAPLGSSAPARKASQNGWHVLHPVDRNASRVSCFAPTTETAAVAPLRSSPTTSYAVESAVVTVVSAGVPKVVGARRSAGFPLAPGWCGVFPPAPAWPRGGPREGGPPLGGAAAPPQEVRATGARRPRR